MYLSILASTQEVFVFQCNVKRFQANHPTQYSHGTVGGGGEGNQLIKNDYN